MSETVDVSAFVPQLDDLVTLSVPLSLAPEDEAAGAAAMRAGRGIRSQVRIHILPWLARAREMKAVLEKGLNCTCLRLEDCPSRLRRGAAKARHRRRQRHAPASILMRLPGTTRHAAAPGSPGARSSGWWRASGSESCRRGPRGRLPCAA